MAQVLELFYNVLFVETTSRVSFFRTTSLNLLILTKSDIFTQGYAVIIRLPVSHSFLYTALPGAEKDRARASSLSRLELLAVKAVRVLRSWRMFNIGCKLTNATSCSQRGVYSTTREYKKYTLLSMQISPIRSYSVGGSSAKRVVNLKLRASLTQWHPGV